MWKVVSDRVNTVHVWSYWFNIIILHNASIVLRMQILPIFSDFWIWTPNNVFNFKLIIETNIIIFILCFYKKGVNSVAVETTDVKIAEFCTSYCCLVYYPRLFSKNVRDSFCEIIYCLVWFWRYLTRGLAWHLSQSSIRPIKHCNLFPWNQSQVAITDTCCLVKPNKWKKVRH